LFSALFEFILKTGCLCQFLLVVFTAVSRCDFTVQLATLQNLFLHMQQKGSQGKALVFSLVFLYFCDLLL